MALYTWIQYKPLTYNNTYVYPVWAQSLAWSLVLVSFAWIPGFAIYQLIHTPGSLLQVKHLLAECNACNK